jgi:tryptophan-rich sensory protein
MNYEQYYNQLSKPFFAPPSNIFGIVWPFLYVLIIVSFGWVLYQILIKKRWNIRLFIIFGVNIIANALYSPLFFNWQKPLLATLDIFVVLASIVTIMILMRSRAKWVMVAQVPYLLWVGFATILQVSILIKNWN